MRVKNNTLSDLHDKLDSKGPWSEHEINSYSPQDRAFIRNLQLKDKISKDKAKKKFINYANKSKTAFRKLGRETRKFIKEHYPKHKVFTTGKGKFKLPKGKGKAISHNPDVNKYIRSNPNHKTYPRVVSAAKKYPYASKYELQHGINSEASKGYRKRHKND